jgi:hypothetical protein
MQAVTPEGGSAHVDYGFGRVGILWLDLVLSLTKALFDGKLNTFLQGSALGWYSIVTNLIAICCPICCPVAFINEGGFFLVSVLAFAHIFPWSLKGCKYSTVARLLLRGFQTKGGV